MKSPLRVFVVISALLGVAAPKPLSAATVTLTMQDSSFGTQVNNGGDFFNQNSTELGMWANTGSKQTAGWANFGQSGFGGTARNLQVGDTIQITVAATRAFGQIGFSLNAGGTQGTSYDNKTSGSRLYVNTDNYGSWYVGGLSGGATSSFSYSPVQDSVRDYQFKVYITSGTTADIELLVNAGTGYTSHTTLRNLTLGGSDGENISALSIYGSDMWDGNSNDNAWWKSSSITDVGTVNLNYTGGTGTFDPGVLADGQAANGGGNTVNAVNIGGDAGSAVLLNQANTYTGLTTVNANATARASNNDAFGTTGGGVTVTSGGAIEISGTTAIGAESLTLNGSGISSNGALRNTGNNNSWAGLITLGSASRINSDSGTLTLDVASGNAITGAHNLTFGGAGSVTVNDPIATSTGTLTKDGTGTLTLGGVNNTYTGATIINAGTISISADTALGAAPGSATGTQLQFGGGTLRTTANVTLATNRGITVNSNGGTLSVDSNTTLTYGGVIAGSNTLNKTGAGTLSLGGVATHSGNFDITEGTVALTGSGSLASSARINIGSGDKLDISGLSGNTSVKILSEVGSGNGGNVKLGARTLTMNGGEAGTTYQFKSIGESGDTGGFTLNAGTGTTILRLYGSEANASLYTGTTTLQRGTLTVFGSLASTTINLTGGNLTTEGANGLADSSVITLSSADSTLTIGGSDTIASLSGSAGKVTFSGGTLTTGGTSSTSFSGTLEGSGNLIKQGSGTFTLGGAAANTYSGTTTVNAGVLLLQKTAGVNAIAGTPTINSGGTLRLGANNQFAGDSTFLTINSGGRFEMNGNSDTLAFQGAGTIDLGAGTLSINPGSTDTFSGNITGSGGLIKINTGTQILSGASDFTGTTQINSGVLRMGNATALGTTAAGTTVASGAALQLSNNIAVGAETLTLSGDGVSAGGSLRNVSGNNSWAGSITNSSGARINADSGTTLTVSGAISNAASQTLYVGGAGNVVLSGNLTMGTVSGGNALFLDTTSTNTISGSNSGLTGNVRVASSGTVLVGSASALGTGDLTFAPATTATIAAADGTARTLGNGTTYIYGTGLNLGLATTSTGSLTFGAVNLGNDATGSNQRTITTAAGSSHTFGAVAGGANNTLIKAGAGTLILSAASATTGGVQLNDGALLVGNNSALGTGTLQVQFDVGSTKTLASSSSANYTLNNNINIYNDLTLGQTTGGTGSLTLGGTVQLGNEANQNRTLFVNGSQAFSGSVQGARGIVKQGDGTLTFSGANTFTGHMYIDSGAINLNGGSLGAGSIEIGAGSVGSSAATLRVTSGSFSRGIVVNSDTGAGARTIDFANTSGTTTLSGNVSLEKDVLVTVGTGGTGVFSGIVSNSGGIIKQGSGVLTLSGNNTSTGAFYIDDGVLNLSGGTQGAGTIDIGANTVGAANATLRVSSGSFSRNITVNSDTGAGARTIDFANTTGTANLSGTLALEKTTDVSVAGGGTGALSGVISGAGGLTKSGTGTLTVSGNNTFDGHVTINAGKITMSHANALGDTGTITVAAGADLDLTANINVGRSLVLSAMSGPTKGGRLLSSSGANTYSGGITVNNSEFDVASGSTLDVTGKITGSGTVTKTGLGELLLNNTGNDYTGITDVQNGTLTASTIANSSTASTIGSGSELKVGSASTAGTFKYTGTTASMNRTVTVGSAGGTINVNDSGATMTLTGTVAGSGATLTKTGAGRLALGSGSSTTVSTIAIQQGTLLLGASNQIDNGTAITLSGGTLALDGKTDTVGRLTVSANSIFDFGTAGGSATSFTFSDFGTYSGAVLTINNAVAGSSIIFNTNYSSNTNFDFGNPNSFVSKIQFGTTGQFGQISFGTGTTTLLVAIPDARVYSAAVALLILIGATEWKRRRGTRAKRA